MHRARQRRGSRRQVHRDPLPRPHPRQVALHDLGDERDGARRGDHENVVTLGHEVARIGRVGHDDPRFGRAQRIFDQTPGREIEGALRVPAFGLGLGAASSMARAPASAAALLRDTSVPSASPRQTRSPSATLSAATVPLKGARTCSGRRTSVWPGALTVIAQRREPDGGGRDRRGAPLRDVSACAAAASLG